MDEPWPTDALYKHNELSPYLGFILQACIDKLCDTMPSDSPILEIGAGTGYVGSLMPEKHRQRFIQTEIGTAGCHEIRKNNPDLVAIAAKGQELPFASASIGGVIARNVFDMVDTEAVIDELARVVRPGGVVAHIHDHRPSLVWIREHFFVGKSKRLMPYFDEDGYFDRYQVVGQASLKRIGTSQNRQLLEYLSNPHLQEHLSGGEQQGSALEALKTLSKQISVYKERTTPTFKEIVDKLLVSWFKKANFTPVASEFSASTILPMEYATLYGWDKSENYLSSYSNGYHACGYDAALPEDKLHISHSFNVLTATKP